MSQPPTVSAPPAAAPADASAAGASPAAASPAAAPRAAAAPLTVFITGASAGFGAAIARRFLDEGHRVVAAARRTDRLDALAPAQHAQRLHAVALDVRDRDAVLRCPDALPDAFRDVDVLINNAGLALGLEPAQRADPDDWDTMIDTNAKGLVMMTRAFLPGMVRRGRGHVINIGSTAGSYPYPGANVYGASKAFVNQFTLNLRSDLAGTGVRATVVEPGMVGGTEFSDVRFHGDRERASKVYDRAAPMSTDDIAETVHWIATLPPHVNVNRIELMPVGQSFAAMNIQRS